MTEALDYMDSQVTAFGNAYASYQAALKLAINDLMDSRDPFLALQKSPEVVREIRREWTALLDNPDESDYLVSFDTVSEFALEDSLFSESDASLINTLNNESAESFSQSLRDAMRLDAMTVIDTVRKIKLRVHFWGGNKSAGVALLRSEMMSGMDFVRPIRTGQKWSTVHYLKTEFRRLMVDAYTDSFAVALSHNGVDTAQIELSDGTVKQFSLASSLEDIRKAHLHPNATRMISRV